MRISKYVLPPMLALTIMALVLAVGSTVSAQQILVLKCNDQIDNDGDGFIDYGRDYGCSSLMDNDETDPPNADVSIVISGPATVTNNNTGSGTIISYTLTVSNAGPSTMPHITIYDVVSQGLVFRSASDPGCRASAYYVICSKKDLQKGQSTSITLTFVQTPAAQCIDKKIVSTAYAYASITDRNMTNNQAAVTTTSKCAMKAACQDGIDNDGDSAADFPADFSCSSPQDADETWPKAQCGDGIDNDTDGLIDFPQDPGCASKQDNDEYNAPTTADLSITKKGPTTVTRGSTLSYNVTVTNLGAATANNIVIADPIPFGLTASNFNAARSSGCVLNSNQTSVLCDKFSLASGQNRTFNIVFNVPTVTTCTQASLNNIATVSSSTTDAVAANNTSATITTAVTCPQLQKCADGIDNDGDGFVDYPSDYGCSSIIDNDETDPPNADVSTTISGPVTIVNTNGEKGIMIDYTINVYNLGPHTVPHITIYDMIPKGLVFARASDPSCVARATYVTCVKKDLLKGQTASYTLTFNQPHATQCIEAKFFMTAAAYGSIGDRNMANNQITTSTLSKCTPQCSDGLDNDFDGAQDYPQDVSCDSAMDTDETNPKPQCNDGIDNDADGKTDFPSDPSCVSTQGTDESKVPLAQCEDGIDNDGDGKIDYPQDPGCNNAKDSIEKDVYNDFIVSLLGSSPAWHGSKITYTLSVQNNGFNELDSLAEVQHLFPADLTYVATESDAGCTLTATGIVTCKIERLSIYQTKNFTLTYTVGNTLACPGQIESKARMSLMPNIETNPRDNEADSSRILYCEQPMPACNDQRDNDFDGNVDYPEDKGCSSAEDNDETNPSTDAPLTISIDGPASQTYTRKTDDAVFADVRFDAGSVTMNVKDLFVAIQATNKDGKGLAASNTSDFDGVSEVLEDVHLRNIVTGQRIQAMRLLGFNDAATNANATYQIYRFDDVVISGTSTWEVRGDFIDNGSVNSPRKDDAFRIHICAEAWDSFTPDCNFGGVMSMTSVYEARAEILSTGEQVVNILPGGNISGNYHRIGSPEFFVSVKSIGLADAAVKNEKNINLLRFEGRSGDTEDILFTRAAFTAQAGSLLNAQNYTLWVDTDDNGTVDTILENGVLPGGGIIIFDNFAGGGFIIPKGKTVAFEVHADVSASLTNNQLQLKLATGYMLYIEAEQAADGSLLDGISTNGACPATCEIFVTTTDSKLWNLASQGSLFVTRDTPQRSRQLLGGTLTDAILHLDFRAQVEDIEVTDLQFTSMGSNANSVDRIELYKDNATTPFAIATVGGCGSDDVITTHNGIAVQTYCANMEWRQLVVPEGLSTDVFARLRLKTDEQGATSGQPIQFFLSGEAVSDNGTGRGAVRARGAISSSNLVANDGDSLAEGEVFIGTNFPAQNNQIVGSTNVAVLSKITSITDANPDSSKSFPAVPSGVYPIGQFKFSAAANNNSMNGLNKAKLTDLIFTVNAANVQINPNGFAFYKSGVTSQKAPCYLLDGQITDPTFWVACWDIGNSTVDTELDSGESSTFVLEMDIQNPNTSSQNSSLQVTIDKFTDSTVQGMAHNLNHIRWLDKDTAQTQYWWIEYPDSVVPSTHYKS